LFYWALRGKAIISTDRQQHCQLADSRWQFGGVYLLLIHGVFVADSLFPPQNRPYSKHGE